MNALNDTIDRYKAALRSKSRLTEQKSIYLEKKEELESEVNVMVDAKKVYALAIMQMKNTVTGYIEKMVTTVLQEVYNSNDVFTIDFTYKYKKYSIEYFLENDTSKVRLKAPFIGKGGGKVTLIALMCRLSYLLLKGGNPVIMLDEVTRMIDSKAINKVITMLAKFSKKFNKTILLVTHRNEVKNACDIVYTVKQEAGVSTIQQEVL